MRLIEKGPTTLGTHPPELHFASAPAEVVRGSLEDSLFPPPPLTPSPPTPTPFSPFPRHFLAARQDRLAYVIREVDAKAWEFRGSCTLLQTLISHSLSNIWEFVVRSVIRFLS